MGGVGGREAEVGGVGRAPLTWRTDGASSRVDWESWGVPLAPGVSLGTRSFFSNTRRRGTLSPGVLPPPASCARAGAPGLRPDGASGARGAHGAAGAGKRSSARRAIKPAHGLQLPRAPRSGEGAGVLKR